MLYLPLLEFYMLDKSIDCAHHESYIWEQQF